MDPNYPNFCLVSKYPDNLHNYPNTQYENSEFPSYENNVSIPETVQTSQKSSRVDPWEPREDLVIMSALIFISEDSERGKNQKRGKLWNRVKTHYDATRAEIPTGLGDMNENQMKGRWSRLNKNAARWVSAYREAYRQKKSGMSNTDVENIAHRIYEAGGKKFNDLVVFNEVMCKHPKWALELHREITRSRSEFDVGGEESGGSTKRSRTTEEGDSVDINQESPTVGGSTIQRPACRYATKKRGKGKTSQSSSISDDSSENLRALTITRKNEAEILEKKKEFYQENFQMVHDHKFLCVFMSKENLSPAEEELKQRLMAKLYGQ